MESKSHWETIYALKAATDRPVESHSIRGTFPMTKPSMPAPAGAGIRSEP